MLNRFPIRLQKLYRGAPVLFLAAAILGVDLIFCLIMLHLDHTVITGLPAWIKPTKFAISTGIYALSLIAILRWTAVWPRTIRVMEAVIGVAAIIEILLIDMQAFRHTTSHFNIATPFDAAVYSTMGASIGMLWLASIVVTVAVFRSNYRIPALTMALRAGLLLTVLGAGTGWFMTRVTPEEHAEAGTTQHLTTAGAHTVGGLDGGAGLSLLGWSTQHGDVRVAHFIGLHALQVLVAVALALRYFGIEKKRAARLILAAAASYAAVFLFTLVEALEGFPITDHSRPIEAFWLAWITLSLLAFLLSVLSVPVTHSLRNLHSHEA